MISHCLQLNINGINNVMMMNCKIFQWIWSRLPAAPLGSPTLMLFSEIEGCIRRQLFVSDVIEALRHIRNDACVTILQPFAGIQCIPGFAHQFRSIVYGSF